MNSSRRHQDDRRKSRHRSPLHEEEGGEGNNSSPPQPPRPPRARTAWTRGPAGCRRTRTSRGTRAGRDRIPIAARIIGIAVAQMGIATITASNRDTETTRATATQLVTTGIEHHGITPIPARRMAPRGLENRAIPRGPRIVPRARVSALLLRDIEKPRRHAQGPLRQPPRLGRPSGSHRW